MDNRFFSLIVIPDSGREIKAGGFTGKFILGIFSALTVTFFVCLFFIIGYHIKLSQEKEYKTAVSVTNSLLARIDKSQKLLYTLNTKIAEIHKSDQSYRLYASGLNVLPDEDIYNAGIGGHVFVDDSELYTFSEKLRIKLKNIFTGTAAMVSRIEFQRKSLETIQLSLAKDRDHIDNTPSIIPTPNSFRITDRYGMRRHPIKGYRHFHDAVDLAGTIGDPVKATASGEVINAKYQRYLGNSVTIKHKYGYETLYAHLHRIKVKVGDKMNKGDVVGTMGRTGRTTGTHLHYRICLNGKSQNPLGYFF